MTTYAYSAIADADVLDFKLGSDVLWFDAKGISAADLQLSGSALGNSMVFMTPTKTFTLDGVGLPVLDSVNLLFANGSMLVNSTASNLYADDLAGGAGNDLLVGGAATLPIERSSVSANGAPGNGSSFLASLNADGRYVGFLSAATNLVPGDTTGQLDVFVRDNLTGAVTRASTSATGQAANRQSEDVALSADGRFVAFASAAGNLMAGDTNSDSDVFVKDLASGAITRVSTSSQGSQSNGYSSGVSLSADAQFVAFHSQANNLVNGADNGISYDVFVKNLASGELLLASTSSVGVAGNFDSLNPSVDASGRWVAFDSFAFNLVFGDTNGERDVFLKDLYFGNLTRVSTAAGGAEANGDSGGASISADGRYVAFHSIASNLVDGDSNGNYDVFVKDMQTGAVRLVSSDASGNEGLGSSYGVTISADGRFVTFLSSAANLVAGDTNGRTDVFVKNMDTGAIARLSTSAAGAQGDGESYSPAISADGSCVAFDSVADNLVAADLNGRRDIFVSSNPLEARVLTGGAGNDVYLISRAQDRVMEASASGSDTVRSTISLVLPANVERLELLGDEALNGTGNSLANVLMGNAADNVLDGSSGTDTASYANATDGVTVDLASTDVQDTGGAGLDTLVAIENLTGSAFADMLFGSAGANALDGGGGADLLIGGAGNDSYSVDSSADQIVEDSSGGFDTVRSTVSLTLGATLENLQLLGSANLNATGNTLANQLTGNRGGNVLNGGGGTDTASYSAATVGVKVGLDKIGPQSTGAGADTLISIENLVGSNFADTLHGSVGNNVLNGGGGIDTLSYARAGAAVTVSLVSTTVQATGGAGSDTVTAFENLTGSAFADKLTGNTGANVLDGGLGADTLTGGAGNDSYLVNDALDSVVEAASGGTDTVIASVTRTLGAEQENLTLAGTSNLNATGNSLANVLTGNAGVNVLNGSGGIDTANYAAAGAGVNVNLATGLATGGGGSDSLISIENLIGSAFADALVGNSVANLLRGGGGADALTGGAGADTFVFSSLQGADTVSDFASGVDRVAIGRADISVGDGDLVIEDAATLVGPNGFAAAAELVVVTGNIAGAITRASAAAAIGDANSAYAVGARVLFAVDDGSTTALYRFSSLDSDANVSADELTLLTTLTGTAQTTIGDYLFMS